MKLPKYPIPTLALCVASCICVTKAEEHQAVHAPAFENLPVDSVVKLADLPKEPPQWVNVTPDGKQILMLARKGSRHAVFVNGVADKVYDEIYRSARFNGNEVMIPAFTVDGSVSLLLVRKGSSFHLLANGVESPAYEGVIGFWPSPAGSGYVLMATRNNQLVVHRDGKDLPAPTGSNEKLQISNVLDAAYSADGRRFVYLAVLPNAASGRRSLKWILDNDVIDAAPSDNGGTLESRWVFGPENTWACLEERRGVDSKTRREFALCRVNFSGNRGPEFAEASDLQISADGKHVAYRAMREPTEQEVELALPRMEGEDERAYKIRRQNSVITERSAAYKLGYLSRAILDHKECPVPGDVWDKAIAAVLGPRGQFAVAYECGFEKGKRRPTVAYKVWVDGKTSMEYEGHLATRFVPDGSKAISFVTMKQSVYLLENAEETDKSFGNVDLNTIAPTVDGKGLSFFAVSADGKNIRQETGGSTSPSGTVIRSADGKRELLIHIGERPYEAQVPYHNLTVGDKTYKIEGEVVEAMLSADGTRVACIFRPGAKGANSSYTRAWVDGAEIPPLAGQYSVSDTQFSSDGKHFAYTATVSVEDHSDKSPGASGQTLHVRVIDQRPGPLVYLDYKVEAHDTRLGSHFKDKMYPTTFGEDGSASYFARRAGALYRISFSDAALAGLPDFSGLAKSQADAGASKVAEEQQVQKAAAAADPFQVPHVFEWPYLEQTCALVEGNDGKLYGSAFVGRFKTGGLFRCNGDGSEMKVLHEFTGEGGEGLAIRSIIKTTDGTLYMALGPNMHASEQPKWKAAIFRLDPGTDKPVPVYLAPAEVDRKTVHFDVLEYPLFTQVTSDHLIYGGMAGPTLMSLGFRLVTKPQPGLEIVSNNTDYIWSFSKNGVNLIATPGTDSNDNKNKVGLLPIEAGGRLYSITGGGRGHAGMIVSTARDGTDIRTEYEFTLESPEGGKPSPLLQAGPDGSVFGFTTEGGSREDWQNRGAVFRFNPADKSCVPVVLADHYHGIGWPVCFGRDGRMYFTAGGELHGISAAEAASGKPFGFPDQNKKVKANETSARFPEKLHAFTAFQNKKIEEYGVTSFGILTMVSLADGSFAGIGATGGLSNPPFLFTVRPKK